jgi:peptidyl-prolyl cis-trans isomerase B (cyclophilin B)
VSSKFIGVILTLVGALGLRESAPPAPVANVTISCLRQSIAVGEACPIRLVVTPASEMVRFDRTDLVSVKSFVASKHDHKGQWVEVPEPPAAGPIELRRGESFSMDVRVMLPATLTQSPSAVFVEWVGAGPLDGLRSNQITVQVRPDTNPTATLETSEGTIALELWPDKAPNHVANLLTLAKKGFYDGLTFHRVIPNFMVQTGDPLGNGTGDPGYKIAAEFNDMPFVKGTLGMARASAPDSAGSQFFVCVADHHDLDRQYTAFGRVIEGQEIADKISMVPSDTQHGNKPYKDVVLKKVTVTMPATYALPEVKKVEAAGAESKPASRTEPK